MGKHQKVPKYYENDCLQNSLLLFMSLLTAKFSYPYSFLFHALMLVTILERKLLLMTLGKTRN